MVRHCPRACVGHVEVWRMHAASNPALQFDTRLQVQRSVTPRHLYLHYLKVHVYALPFHRH